MYLSKSTIIIVLVIFLLLGGLSLDVVLNTDTREIKVLKYTETSERLVPSNTVINTYYLHCYDYSLDSIVVLKANSAIIQSLELNRKLKASISGDRIVNTK